MSEPVKLTALRWRVIGTDSYGLDGIAPVCPHQDDYTKHSSGDGYMQPPADVVGVYDCCPWPQIECGSEQWAGYLVSLLNAATDAADGMPVFVIKAKDSLAAEALRAYRGLCFVAHLHGQVLQVSLALNELLAWQDGNPDRVKLPDHQHVPAATTPPVTCPGCTSASPSPGCVTPPDGGKP